MLRRGRTSCWLIFNGFSSRSRIFRRVNSNCYCCRCVCAVDGEVSGPSISAAFVDGRPVLGLCRGYVCGARLLSMSDIWETTFVSLVLQRMGAMRHGCCVFMCCVWRSTRAASSGEVDIRLRQWLLVVRVGRWWRCSRQGLVLWDGGRHVIWEGVVIQRGGHCMRWKDVIEEPDL